MQIFITVIHVTVCIVLILVVLLQAGKGASMGAAFGGSSQTIFGSSGPGTFLSKMTSAIALIFMLTSLFLSYVAVHKRPSLLDNVPRQQTERRIPAAPMQQPTMPQGTEKPAEVPPPMAPSGPIPAK